MSAIFSVLAEAGVLEVAVDAPLPGQRVADQVRVGGTVRVGLDEPDRLLQPGARGAG